MCRNIKRPYLNNNKVIQVLLEVQIQARLRAIHGMVVYLFNTYVLIDNMINPHRTPREMLNSQQHT